MATIGSIVRGKARVAVIAIVALMLTAVVPAGAATPSNVVNVHDYCPTTDGNVDNTACVQAAFNQFMSGTSGKLYFPAGHYLVHPLCMCKAGNAPIFGNVEGDGPELTVIHSFSGERALLIQNYIKGEFGGMKFSGGPASGRGSANINHAGLVLGNASPGLGTEGNHFHNLSFENYGVGLLVGDPRTAGSAAENIFSNIGISRTHWGVYLSTFNTLDNLFEQLNLGDNDYGVFSEDAYSNQFINGAGNNNLVTFHLLTPGQELIQGWREEIGANYTSWIEYGGAAAPTLLTVIGSNTVDSAHCNGCPPRQFAHSIHALTSAAQVTVISSQLDGPVDGKKVTVLSSTFTGASDILNPQWVAELNSCMSDVSSGQCATDLPNRITGVGGSGPPASTATPMPATPTRMPSTATPMPSTATPVPASAGVRWNSHGNLSTTTHAQLAYMVLNLTNTGTTMLRSTDLIHYEWDRNGAYVSSDNVALSQDVVPGATFNDTNFAVSNPPTAGSYVLKITLAGSELDIAQTIN